MGQHHIFKFLMLLRQVIEAKEFCAERGERCTHCVYDAIG
jgi:hypothetical protein